MKVIVAGSRGAFDRSFVWYVLQHSPFPIAEIVCGGARGVDTLGKSYGDNNNIPVKTFLAKWNDYGKKAGFIRNKEMAEYADALILIWDGSSPGSALMKKIWLEMHGSDNLYEVIYNP